MAPQARIARLSLTMDILSIETSTARGSAALWRDGRLVEVCEFTSERAHNAVIFAPLARLLDQVRELELVVAGTGPGSYTGVRVGIAAAAGIALAKNVPLIGLPSICALTHAVGLDRYAVCGDARRGSWWWAEVESGSLSEPPVSAPAEECAARAAAWTGHIFTADAVSPPWCPATVSFPRAEILATAGSALSPDAVERLVALPVEPLYLSAPFITVSKQPVFA